MRNSLTKKKFSLPDWKWIAKGNVDIGFLLLVFLLLAIGLVMLASAGYSLAYHRENEDSYAYIRDQLIFSAVGLVTMFAVSKINYNYFRRFVLLGVGVSILLLIVALIIAAIKERANPNGGEEIGRWIQIPGIGQFQPSEMAKVGLIAFYAWGCEKYHQQIVSKKAKTAFLTAAAFGGVGLVFIVLVYLEHHLSGTILFVALTIAMLYLGEFNKWWFRVLIPIIIIVVAIFVINPKVGGILDKYQLERIVAWKDKTYEPRDARW
ncbi:MAG: FtsW/RodA/SpoVE family cell cycle protein, partial [Clostridia bacterium]|nr:FtsW/RodA/SpoVE family cell cycle protein [Clostridia bacterium]